MEAQVIGERFEVTFDWDIEEGVTLRLRVRGLQQPIRAELPAGFKDPGVPAEGGELEDIQVYSGCRLPKAIEDGLLKDSRFMDELRHTLETWGRWV